MITLLKKDLMEIFHTYRWWLIPTLFLFLSLSAVASAKFLPAIMESQLEGQRIRIEIPTPVAEDAFQSYFKNLAQIGLLAVILLSMGLLSEENSSGVSAMIVTKPVSRAQILISKSLVHGTWLIVSVALSAMASYLYTVLLFGRTASQLFFLGNLIFMLYLLLVFSLTIGASAVSKSSLAAGGIGVAAFILFSLLPALSTPLAQYSPAALVNIANQLALGKAIFSDALWPALVTLITAISALAIGAVAFDRQEL